MRDLMITRDVYMRSTLRNGRTTVNHHRLWDAHLFIVAKAEEAKRNQHHGDELTDVVRVELITEDQYRRERR